jgi:steroid delta-isomerase
MPATAEQTRTAIEHYLKAWQTNDRQLLLDTFAKDARWEDPVGSEPFIGHEGIAKFWDAGHSMGNHMTPVLTQIIVCGSEGILRFTMQVRSKDGKSGLDLHVVDRMVVNEQGKIQLAQAYWDAGCAEQPKGMEMFVPSTESMER